MKIGDKVSVLDEAISGVVIGMEGTSISVKTTDGFPMQFSKDELVLEDSALSKIAMPDNIETVIATKETRKKNPKKRVKPKERVQPAMEVDLHIHQLTGARNLSNFEMLTIQLDEAKRQLEFAMSKKIQKVVFIHGVGEGVLKIELQYLFKQYENLKYYDADYRKYGAGATEVYIFQNVKAT